MTACGNCNGGHGCGGQDCCCPCHFERPQGERLYVGDRVRASDPWCSHDDVHGSVVDFIGGRPVVAWDDGTRTVISARSLVLA